MFKFKRTKKMELKPIFLASYPRSGNTYLRTILNHCFDLKSASIYPNDLGGNATLEKFVGHIEHIQNGKIPTEPFLNKPLLIKTHVANPTDTKAIYVVRNAYPVMLSLHKFYNYKQSLEDVIKGNHQWGIWADHVENWTRDLSERKLLLKYEDLKDNLDESLIKLSNFLNVEIRSINMPARDKISDGKWINKKEKSWQEKMEKHHVELCTDINRIQLEKLGYI
jgi:hypothetical protein